MFHGSLNTIMCVHSPVKLSRDDGNLSHGRRVRRWISCRGFLWETFKQLRYCPTQLSNKRGNLFSCSPFIWGGHTLKLDLEIRPDGWLVKHDGSNHTMYGTSNSGNSRRNAWWGALLTRMFNSVVYEATVFSTPSFEPVYARGRCEGLCSDCTSLRDMLFSDSCARNLQVTGALKVAAGMSVKYFCLFT